MHIDPLIYHAAPAMAILIVAESVFMIKEHQFDIKEVLSSLGIMIGRLPIAAITNGFIVYLYTFIYHHRLFDLPGIYFLPWIVCFFADDLSFYWFHRASHSIRFLWASHQVHHSSEKFTFAAGIRIPWTADFSGNFLFWCWMPLIGIKPEMILYMKSLSVLYQFWIHTETINKLPKWFEAFFNTPSHHRVHHGSNVEYLDKNNGGSLIIWDKLFGTFQEEIFTPTYGLTDHFKSFNPIRIVFHEWEKIFRDLKKTRLIRDKVCYFIKPPGWSHDGSSRTTKQLQLELKKMTGKGLGDKLHTSSSAVKRKLMALLILLPCYLNSIAQERILQYDVTRNGNVIGYINVTEKKKDNIVILELKSEVKTKFIFSYTNYTKESVAFENGYLIYASYYQKENDKEIIKTISWDGKYCKMENNGHIDSQHSSPIRTNSILLFSHFPNAIMKIFSNHYQKFLDLTKVSENKYRLTLPDGNYNYYHYKNGICDQVDIERTFFTIHFLLRKN